MEQNSDAGSVVDVGATAVLGSGTSFPELLHPIARKIRQSQPTRT
jgi:hypothetical protein